jgi:superfamily II DNA or RNA helicase
MTLEEFINKSNKVHDNKFDYSITEQFKNQNDKVFINCPKHGKIEVNVGNHLNGSDCMRCTGNTKRNTKSFILELDSNGFLFKDYDYSLVDYKTTNSKVIIIDKKFDTKHSILPKELLKGKRCSSSNLADGYLGFEDAREFVWNLNLKNEGEWRKFLKSENRPWNITTNPSKIYKDKGWISMSDWLGTKKGWDGKYLDFDVAREIVRKENLQTQNEWYDYVKNKKPNNIPSNPQFVYKEKWKSLPDWIGTKEAWEGFQWKSYEDAKKFVHSLNLKNTDEWDDYTSKNKLPKGIPSYPNRIYKEFGFSMGDWLGTGNVSNRDKEFYSFSKSREIVHQLGLKSGTEWKKYIESDEYDTMIPKAPQLTYKEFVSMGDFLGYIGDGSHQWTKSYILDFIKNIKEELIKLDSIELITIINSNNLAKKIKDLGFLEDLVSSRSNTVQRENVVSKIQKHISDLVGNSAEEEFVEEEVLEDVFKEELKEGDDTYYDSIVEAEELADFKPLEELKFYDNKLITSSLDDENIDFLLKNQLKKLWNSVLNNEISIDEIIKEDGGKNFKLIKDKFIKEYKEVSKIIPPQDYVFKYPPNLMQKLVTYRMEQERLYGNWSGTGAGKTLSSIFCGRYIELKNTIIICNNSTISGWVNSIHEYFDNSQVYTKTRLNDNDVDPNKYEITHKYDIALEKGRFNYVVLNYETFQLEDGEFIVSELLKKNTIDYIILDEVQNVKQRSEKDESSRRNVINKLIIHSKNENPNLHLMVMSATPVINNLVEPKKLIELISGEVHEELETKSSISNGIEMYKSLTRYGIRYKPKYGITVNENLIKVNGENLVDALKKVPKGSPIGFEKVLINTKLEAIKPYLKKGTLIYSHYVTDLVNEIGKFVADLGFTYGYYIGDDKEGLRKFKNQEIDILIGSAPIGTGVDGIQYVCNTLIPLILPWTSSEYEQLLGRVNRQGSNFDKVNVYIPQVIISQGEKEWSWDKRRYNIINFKSTLADLSMDGIIPKELSPPRSTLVKQAQSELEEWINRISENNILTIDREEIKIPLNPKQIEYKRAKLGDFSELNKNWSISNSKTIHKRLQSDKSEWEYYHTLYRQKRKTWNQIPYMEIAKKIKERPEWIVADMGCGENLLSKEVSNKVHAFDYVAIDNDVTACDMSSIPLADQEINAVVFCLSLMGSNYLDYIKEAFRVTKPYGNIFICEPKKKVERRLEVLKKEIESIGFKIVEVTTSSQFVYIHGIKL